MTNQLSRQNHWSQPKRGFTLVEILIVGAIIALLSAILLGVFARVKDGSRRATCASNLKQIGLASQMYAADNQDRYPNAETFSACAWADRLLPYVHQTSIFECPSATNSPYVTGCPPEAGPDNLDEFKQRVVFDGAYDLCIYPSKSFPSSARFQHPSSTISVLDGSGKYFVPGTKDLADPEVFKSSGILTPRHEGGSNALFLDGHVKWMLYTSLNDRNLWNLGTPPPLKNKP